MRPGPAPKNNDMRTILLSLLLAVPCTAQKECETLNDDGTLVTNVTMGGPNLLLGMRLVAQASNVISAAQVHTGLVAGPGTFAIWSHDAANDRPLANLSGDGSYTQTNVISWQGATLPTPIALTTNQVFWLVWGMPNGSRTPYSTLAAGNVPYRGSFDGGASWSGSNGGATPWPAKPYKYRLFCPYPTNPILPVGTGKPGVVGVPNQIVTGWSAMGNELGLVLTNAAPAAPAILGIGTQTFFSLPGLGDFHVNPLITIVVTTTGTVGRGAGTAGLSLRLPSGGAMGFPLATQWFIFDAAAVGSLSHTDGAHTTIQ